MQVGLIWAAVQVTPGPLLGVVVERQCLHTLGAGPPHAFRMLGPPVNALPLDVQLDTAHAPRRVQAQQVLLQRVVLQGHSLPE
jgi:hypothetical protein